MLHELNLKRAKAEGRAEIQAEMDAMQAEKDAMKAENERLKFEFDGRLDRCLKITKLALRN